MSEPLTDADIEAIRRVHAVGADTYVTLATAQQDIRALLQRVADAERQPEVITVWDLETQNAIGDFGERDIFDLLRRLAQYADLERAARAVMSTTGVNEDDPEKGYIVWWVRRSVAEQLAAALRALGGEPPK